MVLASDNSLTLLLRSPNTPRKRVVCLICSSAHVPATAGSAVGELHVAGLQSNHSASANLADGGPDGIGKLQKKENAMTMNQHKNFVLACGSQRRSSRGITYLNLCSSGNPVNQFRRYECVSVLREGDRVDLGTGEYSARYDRNAEPLMVRMAELGKKGLTRLMQEGRAMEGDIFCRITNPLQWDEEFAFRIWWPLTAKVLEWPQRTWGEVVGFQVEHHRNVEPRELSHGYQYIGASMGLTPPQPNMGVWWIMDGKKVSLEDAQKFVDFWWRFRAHPMNLQNESYVTERVAKAQNRIILI